MSVSIPADFGRGLNHEPGWPAWRQQLPHLVRGVCADWGLSVAGPPAYGVTALVLPVRQADGEPAVVKFGWPDPESATEHLALRAWDGAGAVRLLRADPRRSVLLLERADADRDLHAVAVGEACAVVAGLYALLHRPAPPSVERLSARAADWAARMQLVGWDHLVPRRFVAQAMSLAAELATDPATDGTLIHSDLHYGNVLAATREPWLAIDPKPLSGEPAYEVAPLLWNRWDEVLTAQSARGAILDRFYAVVDQAHLDEDRARAWVIVREMVNVMWVVEEASRGRALDRSWITTATTIVKAVQR